jgi:hypothetical protein
MYNMKSLKNMCLDIISKEIMELPQIIQEEIINTTKSKISNEIKKELDYINKLGIISDLIPEILCNIIDSKTQHNIIRENYREKYSYYPKEVVEFAIKIAEESAEKLPIEYLHHKINIYDDDYHDEDFYDQDSFNKDEYSYMNSFDEEEVFN